MFPQVAHYLQLGHQGLEDVFIGVWVESFDGNCSLRLVFFNSFTFMALLFLENASKDFYQTQPLQGRDHMPLPQSVFQLSAC